MHQDWKIERWEEEYVYTHIQREHLRFRKHELAHWHEVTQVVFGVDVVSVLHQQNVIRSGSHTQTSQTLRLPSPVLRSTYRCSQPPLELCKVLSDSARAFSCAPESTCSDEGAFRMLRDLAIRTVKFWSCWDLCAGLWETLRAAETSVQGLRETWCHILTPVVLMVP